MGTEWGDKTESFLSPKNLHSSEGDTHTHTHTHTNYLITIMVSIHQLFYLNMWLFRVWYGEKKVGIKLIWCSKLYVSLEPFEIGQKIQNEHSVFRGRQRWVSGDLLATR